MKIELDRDDLIKELKDNHYDQADLLVDLIDEGTATFDTMRDVLEGVIRIMKMQGAIDEDDLKNIYDSI